MQFATFVERTDRTPSAYSYSEYSPPLNFKSPTHLDTANYNSHNISVNFKLSLIFFVQTKSDFKNSNSMQNLSVFFKYLHNFLNNRKIIYNY